MMAGVIAGQLLGERYELRSVIGRGGMGEVWLGHDRMLGRDVALKVLDIHGSADHGEAAERFRREATAAAALSHPHVVRIFDAGVADGIAYLVMELLPGPTIAELVAAEGPLPVDRVVQLAQQAADGLAAVHRAGIVHRDVKPSNLMLDGQGKVRVVDFGIARLAEATATQVTATGTVVGSAAYLSPEQARGEAATPASDQYALGCVLMTMLTGRPPYEAEHPMALLRQHLEDAPPRVRARRPEVPKAIDQLVDYLLSKEPARRAVGFAVLVASAGGGTTGAMPTPGAGFPPAPPAPPVPTAVLATSPLPETSQELRSPQILLVVGVVLLVLLAVVLLIAALSGGDDADPTDAAASASGSQSATDRPRTTGTTTPAPATTPPTTDQPTSTPPASDLGGALDGLDQAIRTTLAEGGLDEKGAEDLLRAVEDLRKHAGDDKLDHVAKKLDDLSKKLDDLIGKGEVDAAGAARIDDAIDAARAAL